MPVPDFSPGEVLTAAAMDQIGLWLVKTQTFTSTQNCNVTDCFSSDYENYVAIVNGTFSLAGQITAVQLLTGTTPKTTNYNRACFFMTPTVNLTMISQATGAADFSVSGQNASHNSIKIDFFRPNMNQPTGLSSEGQYGSVVWRGGGEQTENYVADGFRMLPVGNAALFTGIIRVYGYRN